MDGATDSRITAHPLPTAHRIVVCNVLLLALLVKYGGTQFAAQLALATALLYYHTRTYFDRHALQDFADNHYSSEDFDQFLQQNGLR